MADDDAVHFQIFPKGDAGVVGGDSVAFEIRNGLVFADACNRFRRKKMRQHDRIVVILNDIVI